MRTSTPLQPNSGGQPSGSATHARPARLEVLDSTRGIAMLFVCLSHFTWAASETLGPSRLFGSLMTISMVASPTFLLVSGITLGYVHRQTPGSYGHFKAKLRERGILLLTVAHWAMVPSFFYMAPRAHEALRVLPITDTIGVCLLIGPLLVERVTRRARGVIAAGLLALTWTVILTLPLHPTEATRIVEGALFGAGNNPWWFYSFPVVPWFAVYLLGSVIGEKISFRLQAERRDFSWTFVKWAGGFTIAALLLEIGSAVVITFASERAALAGSLGILANPLLKYPPTVAYLLTYSAAGLVMAAITARLVEGNHLRWLTKRAGEIGRSSLPIFVVQSYLYYFIELHVLPPRHVWPLYFLATLGIVYLTARLWLAAGGNELLRLPGWHRYRLPAPESAPAKTV
jgi:uncharacterized membrane protein